MSTPRMHVLNSFHLDIKMIHMCMITALIKLTVTDFTSLMDKCCMQAEKNIAEVLITYCKYMCYAL